MRRSWVVAGVLILAAVPSVPVAAAGVSLVLERVNGAEGVGKWVRTGDTQRFRVRLNGMARGARVAVAASPVEALQEVSCLPSSTFADASAAATSQPGPASAASPRVGTATAASPRVGTATVAGAATLAGAAPAGGAAPDLGMAGTLTMRALSVVGRPATKAAPPPGTRMCALGKVTGERAVDVTLRTPSGAREVVLAAVARVRDVESGGLTTMSRTAAVRDGEVVAGETATIPAPAPAPASALASVPSQAAPAHVPAHAHAAPVRTAPAHVAPGRTEAVQPQAAPARTQSALVSAGRVTPRAQVGPHRRSQALPQRTQAAPQRAHAAPHRTRAAPRRAVAAAGPVPGVGGALVIPSAIPSVVPSAAAQGATTGGTFNAVPGPSASAAPQATGGMPQATPGVPQVSGGGVPQPLPVATGNTPGQSGQVDSFQAEVEGGEAPLPWGMAVSMRPVERVRWASPIDGPGALPMVVVGIGVLMAALSAVVTVQGARNRRKVL